MEQAVDSLNPRKRSAADLDAPACEEASIKRVCSESSSASPHLILLEEKLYDLEGEEDGAILEVPLESSTQEDLVAEMMKSLEKVIEESGESRGEEEASTSNPSGFDTVEGSLSLDFAWSSEEIGDLSGSAQIEGFHEELEYEEDFRENAQIREMLQASDDELGLPLSSSSSDLEESAFHEEWASLVNESSMPMNANWLDASFHQFDDTPTAVLSKDIFEPLLLF